MHTGYISISPKYDGIVRSLMDKLWCTFHGIEEAAGQWHSCE